MTDAPLSRWQPYPAYKPSGVEWLGDIPAHWKVSRLKDVANINPESLSEATDPDYILQYVDIGNVDEVNGVNPPQEMRFENAPSRARRIVRSGDTIISTVRTYLKAIAYFDNPPDNLIASTGFAVLRPKKQAIPQYLSALMRCPLFIEKVVARSTGVSYPAIAPTILGTLPVWLPSLEEQRAIATFLDRETMRLDALIAKKQRLIELLQEQRTALISHAVTKGLDPNVPMRDSGIPSIAQVPAHWTVERNKWIFREINNRSTTGEEELLTVSHITGVTPRSEKREVTMFLAESNEGHKRCRRDDLVINTMWAWMGALGVAKHDGIVSPSYNVYRPTRKYIPEYLDCLYRTSAYVCEIIRHSQGIWTSRLRLYPDEFFLMSTPTPPLSEQQAIVEHIEQETGRYRKFIARLEESIERLREYRTALIAAAVTGRMDVRNA